MSNTNRRYEIGIDEKGGDRSEMGTNLDTHLLEMTERSNKIHLRMYQDHMNG